MSYILEALKKSDKERQREGIPSLQADHSPAPVRHEARKQSLLPIFSTVVVLLVAALALSWWRFSSGRAPQLTDSPGPELSPSLPPPVVEAEAEIPVVLESPVVPPAEVREQLTQEDVSVPGGETLAVPPPKAPPATAEALAPAIPVAPVETTAKVPEPELPVETAVKAPEPELPVETAAPVPFLDELAPELRAEIPDFSFAGHVYGNDPARRMIIINNRIVREGESLGNGLSLEEIEANGVTLRYRALVFRVELF